MKLEKNKIAPTIIIICALIMGCDNLTSSSRLQYSVTPNPIYIKNPGGVTISLDEDVSEEISEGNETDIVTPIKRQLYEVKPLLLENKSTDVNLSIYELDFYYENLNSMHTESLLGNSGNPVATLLAKFGEIREDLPCTDNSDCNANTLELGPYSSYYVCLSGCCQTDISFDFRIEFDLDKLVITDSSVIKSPNKAAVWEHSQYNHVLCPIQNDEYTFSDKLYGLNACDRLALERKLRRMDDGDESTGFDLVPMDKANLQLMVWTPDEENGPVIGSISKLAGYEGICDSGEPELLEIDNVVLVDPLQTTPTVKQLYFDASNIRLSRVACGGSVSDVVEYENPTDSLDFCLLDNGEVNPDLLSVDIDALTISKLPLQVVYSISNDVPRSEVLSSKNFKIKVVSNENEIAGSSYNKLIDIIVTQNLGGPPEPIITVDQLYENPEPLTEYEMSGTASCSPFGDARKPFTYQWSWAPGGRPAFAQDAILVCDLPNNPYNVDNDITRNGDEYTNCGETKIFFPIVGTYTFQLKVLDSANQPSGPTAECPDCSEYDVHKVSVKPSKKLYVELVWDKGGDGIRGVDMDLFLVRKREDGSFSVPMAYNDMLSAGRWNTKSCTNDRDCSGGFHCDTNINFCDKACTSDQQCFDYAFGYYCNTEHVSGTPQCALRYEFEPTEENPNPTATIYCGVCSNDDTKHCGNASDCCEGYSCTCIPSDDLCAGKNGYCSQFINSRSPNPDILPIYVCTEHPEEMINDTCSFQNTNPEWGESTSYNDDPSLDIDDVDGYGPETITMKTPVSGTYRVVVRMFSDPLGDVSEDSPVKAFVKILINGSKVEYKDPISGEVTNEPMEAEFTQTRTYWKVADIVWDAEASVDDSTSDAKGNGDVIPISFTPITVETPAMDFDEQPYANPFRAISGPFDPKDCIDPRSIWCDDAGTEINSSGDTCAEVYSNNPPWCL